jgi:hypothetical protein
MNANLSICDSLICNFQELRAASAHPDGDVAQGGALELETGRLSMIRATDGFQLASRILLKLVD